MSPARGRDYAAEYAARKTRAEARGTTVYGVRLRRGERLGLTSAQAAGHPDEGVASASELLGERIWHAPFFATTPDGGGELVDVPLTYAEAQRAGRYMQRADSLDKGRISPAQFRARAARMGPIAGRQVVSDPAVALALVVTTAPSDLVFDSPRAGGQARRK